MTPFFIMTLIGHLLILTSCFEDSFESGKTYPAAYYIDAVSGNDSNDGLAPSSAWKSLDSVNSRIWIPGDSILFHSDQVWFGQIVPSGSGDEGNPIVVSSYGNGKKPVIHGTQNKNSSRETGQTKFATLYFYNQSYWEISNLEITNYNAPEEANMTLDEWEQANIDTYQKATDPEPLDKKNTAKCGILVEARAKGKISHLHFRNLEIHGINGDITSKHNGGIFLNILNDGENIPTWFNDLLIENCYIHDVDRTGVSNWSAYSNRTLDTNTDWVPSNNYILRNNTFERTGANALIVRVANRPVIENNLFDHCAIKESGNACFNFNTDNAIWQYNEARFTKANQGDEDAGGIDSDYRSKNTIIQYNYIHDNDFGMLVTGGSGVFNDGTVVRYNIFEREGLVARHGYDAKFVIRVSGEATNTIFHNNMIFLDASQRDTKIVFHKKWGTWPDKTRYWNNIVYNLAENSSYDFGSSTENEFSNNLFFGRECPTEPEDKFKIKADPLLVNPGYNKEGYKIQTGSPAIGKGKTPQIIPASDFYKNTLPAQGPIDIGIHQLSKN